MSHQSGWCPPWRHDHDHATCQERIDAGLLDGCDCPDHTSHQKPMVERDSRSQTCDNRDGPSRAVIATRPGPDPFTLPRTIGG